MISAPSISWLPGRKVLAGGIGGVVAFGILSVGKHYGIDPQPWADLIMPPPGTFNVMAILTGGITAGIAYIVPPSAKDVVNHLNDDIIAMAQKDPNSPVTAVPPAKAGASAPANKA